MTLASPPGRPLRRGLLALAAAAAVSACGGGTSAVEAFVPERMFAFGDEASVLTATGHKYSVNALTGSTVDCRVQPVWVQSVATIYGYVFAECNPAGVADPRARLLAAPGAAAADLAAQVQAVIDSGGFGGKPLATVLIGANDLWAVYADFPARTEAELVADLQARADLVVAQLERLRGLGVRVILSTVPDQGLTPRALAAGTDNAALLSRLTAAYNARVRTEIVNDGRFVGLVLADEMVQAMARFPASFGLANAKDAACAVPLPDCTADTLVAGAASSTWLWADDRQLAFGGHNRLGLLAQQRALNNPF